MFFAAVLFFQTIHPCIDKRDQNMAFMVFKYDISDIYKGNGDKVARLKRLMFRNEDTVQSYRRRTIQALEAPLRVGIDFGGHCNILYFIYKVYAICICTSKILYLYTKNAIWRHKAGVILYVLSIPDSAETFSG